MFGGLPNQQASYILNPDTEGTELGSKVTVELKLGDVVSYRTCGGGYGALDERDPDLVLRDVREGKVSLEQARQVYRVAIDTANWRVDEVETARLRKK